MFALITPRGNRTWSKDADSPQGRQWSVKSRGLKVRTSGQVTLSDEARAKYRD
jgi:hypothetical protein